MIEVMTCEIVCIQSRTFEQKPPNQYGLARMQVSEHMSKSVCLRIVTAGYGYLRPHVRLFDPGWQGPFVTHTTSGLVADYGNDPVGLISRFVYQLVQPLQRTVPEFLSSTTECLLGFLKHYSCGIQVFPCPKGTANDHVATV